MSVVSTEGGETRTVCRNPPHRFDKFGLGPALKIKRDFAGGGSQLSFGREARAIRVHSSSLAASVWSCTGLLM